jgi:hypothetical protein
MHSINLIIKISGCYRLPPLKGISSSRFEKARKNGCRFRINYGATTLKRHFALFIFSDSLSMCKLLGIQKWLTSHFQRVYSKKVYLISIHNLLLIGMNKKHHYWKVLVPTGFDQNLLAIVSISSMVPPMSMWFKCPSWRWLILFPLEFSTFFFFWGQSDA